MYNRAYLTRELPTVSTPLIRSVRNTVMRPQLLGTYEDVVHDFLIQAPEYFVSSQINNIVGLDAFPIREIIMGCNHAIDSLIMKHGVNGLQIFEHDYKYYQRISPDIKFAQPGQLTPTQPILMALPSPGWLGVHPQQREILDEALSKKCPVHIDGAWLGAAKGIRFNFDHPAIHSVSMSLSKSMDLWWNRVGVRWTRQVDDTDPVTIYNKHKMLSERVIQVGLAHLEKIPPDHVWTHYHNNYYEMCAELKLRPTHMIHVVQSMDRKQIFGVKYILERE